jgi:3-oxoacyl-[acyl-carrier protein] reductase
MDPMGRVAIVTGSSRGIGRAIAVRLAEEGSKIVVNFHRNEEAAYQALRMIEDVGGEAVIVRGDVSDYGDAERIVGEAFRVFGGVDILVNNAGVFWAERFERLDPSSWERMFAVNVFGAFNMTRLVLPYMIESRSGVIINISSIASSIRMGRGVPRPGRVVYVSTKSAINGFTVSLAAELAEYNIRVNAVAPGLTKTDILRGVPNLDERRRQVPLGRVGLPREIAEAVLFLVRNDFVTGEILVVSGGE